jgi:hypothetical protein
MAVRVLSDAQLRVDRIVAVDHPIVVAVELCQSGEAELFSPQISWLMLALGLESERKLDEHVFVAFLHESRL